jgi:hypothetical protein
MQPNWYRAPIGNIAESYEPELRMRCIFEVMALMEEEDLEAVFYKHCLKCN